MPKWSLSADTKKKISAAREALDFELNELKQAYDDTTDRFQDSDRGMGVSEWIDELDNLREEMEAFKPSPD